ncbi:MAG TPA: methyltransferase domain-containing protein, partial [Stellaceae bacterium]|nr:methyltransferase domain-containing protein [Stellaceae bacterium]
MNDSIAIFDRPAVQRHRERAARATSEVDFLINEVTERLLERLQEIKRNFTFVLDLGCREGRVARHVSSRVVNLDPAFAYAARAPGPRLVAEAEALPFAPRSFDLVTSILTLHWINDLPGALWQIREILKPDGLALGAFFGGETLYELRRAFIEAELALEGGAAPRVSPFADIRDLGGLLQRAGFALPVVER